ncbi:MAG: redoxin domain-containing protein [Candidatus Thermoplasmatota archaeon]|nr:redoxin domain-containing protein [Candidatus Thermoplasmatota archaeon]
MKLGKRALYGVVAVAIASLLVLVVAIVGLLEDPSSGVEPAPDFTATDYKGTTFSLSDFAGNVTVLHITQLENPLCIECEDNMIGQIEELSDLAAIEDTNISIVTLNIRKNPYSEEGWKIAEEYYGLNISWLWVEEFEPFPASSQYIGYWMLDGGFVNPTIILIDGNQDVVAVRHVYCIGKGAIDGTQTAEVLIEDSSSILSGEWDATLGGGVSSAGMSAGGMFLLGIVTAFSPCSLALLIAMVSYIGSMRARQKESADGADGLATSLTIGIWFTLGMASVFFMIGLLVAYVGRFLEMSSIFYLISGTVLILVGINAVHPLSVLLARLREFLGGRPAIAASCQTSIDKDAGDGKARLLTKLSHMSPALAGLSLGVLFSVGWAPCALSLVFPVIVLTLTQEYTLLMGGLMLFVFGLGHGVVIIPFCAATGEAKDRMSRKYAGAGRRIQLIFGLAVIAIGVIFALRYVDFRLW